MSKRSKGKQGGRKSKAPGSSAPSVAEQGSRASTVPDTKPATPAARSEKAAATAKPAETRPATDAKPAEKPAEAKAAEAKPASDAKPAEKPAQAKPADEGKVAARLAPKAPPVASGIAHAAAREDEPPPSHPGELPGAGDTGAHQRIEEASFFARADSVAPPPPDAHEHEADPEHELREPTERESRLFHPEVVARRAQFRRWVMGIVAGAAALAALGLILGRGSSKEPEPRKGVTSDTALGSGDTVPAAAAATATTPTAAPTASAEPSATASAEPAPSAAAAPSAEPTPAPASTGLEIPPAPTPAVAKAWERVWDGVAKNSFATSDAALAELTKSTDTATRETARLARALLWKKNGKGDLVAPVIADLAENAKTPSVKARATAAVRE